MNNNNVCLISFLRLRKYIGALGFCLPLILLCRVGFQDSISFTYYTAGRDIFVGTLCAIGIFFICDKGYDMWDTVANRLCGICMLLVANFPCDGRYSIVHYVSATILFITLGLISLFLFTSTNTPTPTDEKQQRNLVYKICGWTILMAVAFIASASALKQPIFIPESVCLMAFGISWAVKGEVILTDK